MAKRLSAEMESQIRESAEHYKTLCPEWSETSVRYGYGQSACLLLAELDATREQAKQLEQRIANQRTEIKNLTAQRDEYVKLELGRSAIRDAVEEERDAAISLLSQLNPNRGLCLNGVAIGWHRDHIAGFVAGIGGSKTIYPDILAAIRAAIAKGGGDAE